MRNHFVNYVTVRRDSRRARGSRLQKSEPCAARPEPHAAGRLLLGPLVGLSIVRRMHADVRQLTSVRSSGGFTLLELMMGITVLGILLGIGVPAFNEIVRNNRVAAQANELMAALSMTRSEATKRGMPVSICAASSAAQTSCAAADSNDWKYGWMIFSDRAGAGKIDESDGDEIVQVSHPISDGLSLKTDDKGFVRFGADGSLLSNAVTFDLKHVQCKGDNLREISIVASGRANLSKMSCT